MHRHQANFQESQHAYIIALKKVLCVAQISMTRQLNYCNFHVEVENFLSHAKSSSTSSYRAISQAANCIKLAVFCCEMLSESTPKKCEPRQSQQRREEKKKEWKNTRRVIKLSLIRRTTKRDAVTLWNCFCSVSSYLYWHETMVKKKKWIRCVWTRQ